jgi:drug/metabolite transporter (DMT)-like permease
VPKFEPLQARTWGGLLFNGILGTGIAYFIWFNIIGRLSTATASLGSLINPVVGVIGAVIILGDRPTLSDIIGFALIFSAAAVVLMPQREKPAAPAS